MRGGVDDMQTQKGHQTHLWRHVLRLVLPVVRAVFGMRVAQQLLQILAQLRELLALQRAVFVLVCRVRQSMAMRI